MYPVGGSKSPETLLPTFRVQDSVGDTILHLKKYLMELQMKSRNLKIGIKPDKNNFHGSIWNEVDEDFRNKGKMFYTILKICLGGTQWLCQQTFGS